MDLLVLGATGTIGRHLIPLLSRAGASVRVATRTPDASRDLPPNARPVAFDFERPATFAPAMRGATAAFVLAPAGLPRRIELETELIAQLASSGVRHVVRISGYGVERSDGSPLRRAELALERSGLSFTHLRPNYFLQNFCVGHLRAGLVERSELAVAAGTAAISFVDARDLAAVAASALLEPRHRNQAYALTGPAALTHAEIALALGEALGRPVRYRERSEGEARQQLTEAGLQPAVIDQRLAFLALARAGAFSAVSPDLEAVLGRPPTTLRQFALDHATLWQKEEPR